MYCFVLFSFLHVIDFDDFKKENGEANYVELDDLIYNYLFSMWTNLWVDRNKKNILLKEYSLPGDKEGLPYPTIIMTSHEDADIVQAEQYVRSRQRYDKKNKKKPSSPKSDIKKTDHNKPKIDNGHAPGTEERKEETDSRSDDRMQKNLLTLTCAAVSEMEEFFFRLFSLF